MVEPSSRESVKVAVRLRPFSKLELLNNYRKIITIDQSDATVFILNPQGQNVQFTYDYAFPDNCTQEEIYENTSAAIVDGVLHGINGTIFAYGQTGSGKTFTIEGLADQKGRGIVPRAFEHIFDYVTANRDSHKFSVTMQYVEIYNEHTRDLLAGPDSDQSLAIREDASKQFYVQGVQIRTVNTIQDLFRFQNEGRQHRVTRQTRMNEESSRSHSILTLKIETLTMIEGGSHVRSARLNLVDLAGSERVSKTGESSGAGFQEGVSINYALMVLGACISALTSRGHNHIPYRDSALTKLLRDSLGGNARTLMIAAVGPADYNFQESMSTLHYAENAKKIKNKPKVNMDPKDALLMQYQEELQRLQGQLKEGTPEAQAANKEKMIKEMEEKLEREKKQLAEASSMAAEERARLQKQLEDQRRELDAQKSAKEEFVNRFKTLKKFLTQGSDKLFQETQKNDEEIAAIREKLRRREEHAAQMQREIEEKKAMKQHMLERCKTTEEKVTMLSEKLKEEIAEYNNRKAKIPEVQKMIQADKDGLAQEIDALHRQLEFFTLVLENFVPEKEVEKFKQFAQYSEENEVWLLPEPDRKEKLKQIQTFERPGSAIGCPRPTAMVRSRTGQFVQPVEDLPVLTIKPSPVESRLKDGPRIIDMNGIEEEIEEQFKDDEADLVVDIPQELPGIAPLYNPGFNIHKTPMR
jgi:kinesin family protein 3/17